MIIEMPNTRTREISQKIDELHEERGESATGRVLTLLIATSRTITAASTPATVYSTTGFTRWAMISPMVGTGVAVGSGLGVGGTCAQARRGRGCGVRQFQSGRPGALRRGRRCG